MSEENMEEYKKLREQLKNAEEKAFAAEEELKYLKASRLIGPVIRARDWLRATQKNVILPHKKIEYFLAKHLSTNTKNKLKYLLRREWLVKKIQCSLDEWPKDKPLVSVITPTWNGGKSALKTIDSILSQTFQNFEYIIVDDGSEEIHKKVIQSIKNPKIQTLFLPAHTESHPPAMARNVGISKARGKYIVCIDDDDWLEPTYLEKAVWALESNPNIALASSYQKMFGARKGVYHHAPYNPKQLLNNNMVTHSAMFRKEAWEKVGGYNENIGYEDWEFWINLAENGYWGKLIPEPLFNYKVSTQNSRYTTDLDYHTEIIQRIRALHPNYKKVIKRLLVERKFKRLFCNPAQISLNLAEKSEYSQLAENRQNVLIAIPWMTFGGAETLIYNFCMGIKDSHNISFVTGLKSEHEWEYKFKEISERIYHLANLFEDERLYLEFISNYITTRDIQILHIIHNGFMFGMLPELKRRHPGLKVIVTMFNDKVEYFQKSLDAREHISAYSTDNNIVGNHYTKELRKKTEVFVIANGLDCDIAFAPNASIRGKIRAELSVGDDDAAIFFVGRLSQEKGADTFVKIAKKVIAKNQQKNAKFFIIGDGPMKREILREIGKDNRIQYLGYRSNISEYLNAADIFALPSRIDGSPQTIIEAMSMGKAVIASGIGEIPVLIDDGSGGFVINPNDVDGFVDKMQKIIEDRDLRLKMGLHNREKVKKDYNLPQMSSRYREMYKRVSK